MRYHFRDSARTTSTGGQSGQPTVVTLDTDTEQLSLKERLEARFAAEVNDFCGEKGKPDPQRTATRHGWRSVKVSVDGRQVPLRVQRMRDVSTGQAFYPPSFQRLVEEEARWREQAVMEYVANTGGATRTFRNFLNVFRLDEDVPGGQSRTAVSNVFQRISRAELEALQSRRFEDTKFAAVMLDGIEVGHRTIVVGLGVTTDGTKIPLGLAEAQSETGEMVAGFLDSVVGRGADLSDVLWVIDGGSGLRDGIKRVFGEGAQVQNCILHKARRVRKKLPKLEWEGLEARLSSAFKPRYGRRVDTQVDNLIRELQTAGERKAAMALRHDREQPLETVQATLRNLVPETVWLGVKGQLHQAWKEPDHTVALQTLRTIATELRGRRHKANADSLETGVEETLTLTRLGERDGGVRRTLVSNNALESVNKDIRTMIKRHHARWRAGTDMRQRWVAVALVRASHSWNTVATPRALTSLALKVAMARHPDITMRVEPWMAGLRLSEVHAPAGEAKKVEAALDRLVRFCDEHEKPLTVMVRPDSAMNLERMLSARGFTADDAPHLDPSDTTLRMTRDPHTPSTPARDQSSTIEQPPAPDRAEQPERDTAPQGRPVASQVVLRKHRELDPVERYRDALGAPAAAQIGARALTLGTYAAQQTDAWLAHQAGRIAPAASAPGLAPAQTGHWMTDNAGAAARVVALAHERARQAGVRAVNPLEPWRSVIGDRRAELIEGRAAHLGRALRARLDAPGVDADQFLRFHEQQLGDPFAPLNHAAWQWVKANGEPAARHIAVARQITLRRELNLTVDQSGSTTPPAQALATIDGLLASHTEHLGEQRTELIRAHAHALTGLVAASDREQLRTWRSTLTDPFAALDHDGAAQTRELETQHRRATRQAAARDRKSAERASATIAELRRERTVLRAAGRDLDDWMIAHADAASHALAADAVLAIDQELAPSRLHRDAGTPERSARQTGRLLAAQLVPTTGGYER